MRGIDARDDVLGKYAFVARITRLQDELKEHLIQRDFDRKAAPSLPAAAAIKILLKRA